jgi:hypothetical protein
MDLQNYLHEGYRQLRNPLYYRQLPAPIYHDTGLKINAILAEMLADNYIDQQQHDYLASTDTDRQRRFYLLPKIHKPTAKWTIPDVMPEGRPIVSNTGSESVRVAQFIDHYLRPISIRHPAYVKDTYDFVSKVRGHPLPPGALLVTADVSSLYTNMTLDRIMSTVRDALLRHPSPGRPDQYLLRLLDLTLRSNDFIFNGDIFLQTCGAAMGIPYAPGLADIYLQEFDEAARTGFRIHPLFYFRYIDDVFFVWIGSTDELLQFQNYLNHLIPGIKIELTYSDAAVQFLDTTVYASDVPDSSTNPTTQKHIETKVYFKPTDTHQLLHKESFHPRHTCTGVLKSQFIRFKRLCNRKSDYDDACQILTSALRLRNYSRSLMRKMKRDVWSDTSLATPRPPSNIPILPLVVPYNEFGCKLATKWRDVIKLDPTFNNYRIITAYTVGHSLHRKLVTSSTTTDTNTPSQPNPHPKSRPPSVPDGCFRCHNNHCRSCRYVNESSTIVSHTNGNLFSIRGHITCRTPNVIYVINCNRCHLQYVGETSRPLADRLRDHLSCIRTHKDSAVGVHFNQPQHSIDDISITGVETSPRTSNAEYRKIRESAWNVLLQTSHPHGINCIPSTRH